MRGFTKCTLPVFAAVVFELSIVLTCVLWGVSYFTNNEYAARSVLGETVAPYDTIWSAMYLAAAPVIIYAIIKPDIRVRVFGLIILGTALALYSVTVISIHPTDTRSYTPLLLSAACFFKTWHFMKDYKFISRRASRDA